MSKTLYTNENFAGKRFGRLVAVEFSHMVRNSIAFWTFICDCGNTKAIERSSVTRGLSTSCGCLAKELTSKRSLIHGQAKTDTKSPSKLYVVWGGIIARCTKPRTRCYEGISVCDEWRDFTNFMRDMGQIPAGKSIDRIDSSKGYYKENCRWATRSEQSRNIRKWQSKETSSKFKGVVWLKSRKRWGVVIRTDDTRKFIGRYKNEVDAARAYNEAALKYHGEFACLNKIPEDVTPQTNNEA